MYKYLTRNNKHIQEQIQSKYDKSELHHQGLSYLRWFISNCSGNENLLKLPRDEAYDMLRVKTEKSLVTELVSKIWQVQYATFSPCIYMAPSWPFYELQEQSQLHAQPFLNYFNKNPTKNVYLVIIYKKRWYFNELKTIDVHCRGVKMSFPIFSDMLFWEARAKLCKIL